MAGAYAGFVDTKYKAEKNDFVVEFSLYPARGVSFEKAAAMVAGESSIGTWTAVGTLTPAIARRLKPSVFYLDRRTHTIRVAYPPELFEFGSIPQLMSSIAGNIFGMKGIAGLRLEDIGFPNAFIKKFRGPRFGIKGVRKILGVKKRPLVGTIVKPKLGLNAKEHASVAFNAWLGGCDIVKSDENLTNMSFNRFEKRVKETLKLKRIVERETGEKKLYLENVTAECNEMLRRARFVKQQGGESIMVDILTVGWSALQTLREANLNLILHGHRAGHASFTRNPRHGISMLVIAKLARLIGLDNLHIGALGKMTGAKEEVKFIGEEIEKTIIHNNKPQHVLGENWLHLKPMFAVCSGGLHPGLFPRLTRILGKDIILQCGGGCHGHPSGTLAGAKAMRQAVDAIMKKIPLKGYAETHTELRTAIKKWGLAR
jgi:ribulose-bisphosphate carboxylase large chain